MRRTIPPSAEIEEQMAPPPGTRATIAIADSAAACARTPSLLSTTSGTLSHMQSRLLSRRAPGTIAYERS